MSSGAFNALRPGAQSLGYHAEIAAQDGHFGRRAGWVFHAHHATADAAIIDDYGEDAQAHAGSRFDFHAGHAEGGVAEKVNHQVVGAAQLGANGGADGPTHGGHTAHRDEIAGARSFPEGNHVATAAARASWRGDGVVGVD